MLAPHRPAITYEPFAALKTATLGNTLSVANDWGNDGRLASRRLYRTSGGASLSSLTYAYDNDDNVTGIVDALNDANSVYYGYDANDRLARTLLTAGTVATGTDTYTTTTGTNRLASIANTSGTRSFGYDARGNLASESRPGSVSATTTYDSYARLTGYVRTDTGTLSFVYNGRDDRVTKTSSNGTRHFVYDPDGREIGEYGTSATDVKAEFLWALPKVADDHMPFGGDDGAGGYMPLAVATPDNSGAIVVNWVHGNHLGVPLVTTDATGAAATTPNDYLAPGFPGQSRTIVDLYYNRYRDYDPTTGRYIQADPIGLQGGQNDYVYAGNNPIRLTDPMGLETYCATMGNCSVPPPGSFAYHGNYCGPGWTGAQWETYDPAHEPFYSRPTDRLDRLCRTHDICYSSCRQEFPRPCDQKKQIECFKQCDIPLSAGARQIGGLGARALAKAIDQHWGR